MKTKLSALLLATVTFCLLFLLFGIRGAEYFDKLPIGIQALAQMECLGIITTLFVLLTTLVTARAVCSCGRSHSVAEHA